MEEKTQVASKEEKAIVQFKGEGITITYEDVKNFICPLADAKEVGLFLRTCQVLQLNPFSNEIFLIKYSDRDKAAIVISVSAYLKAAEQNPNFDGAESGIILRKSPGGLEFREGEFFLEEERESLVGGFARVWRKDRSHPYYMAVNKKDCIKYTREGHPTQFWVPEKQALMLRKTALKRALVEAFASLFAGTSADVDYETLPPEVKKVLPQPKGETPEGELPVAFTKDGQPDWDLFWVRQKEKGVDGKQAHSLLKVDSVKRDLFEKGKTLEEIDQMISDSLEQEKIGATTPTPAKGEEKPMGTQAPIPKEEPKPKPRRDPNTIKSIDDLKQACHELGLTDQDILKEANAPSWMYIVNPGAVYRVILAVRGQP